jgi:hypothetical protein
MTKEAQTPGQQEWKKWLGGLDSNQDNQIQNLMYCQLYDLPVVGKACMHLRDLKRERTAATAGVRLLE